MADIYIRGQQKLPVKNQIVNIVNFHGSDFADHTTSHDRSTPP